MVLGVLDLEITDLESSRDYRVPAARPPSMRGAMPPSFRDINEGQVLGAGIGTGGNSQYLGFTVCSPHHGESKSFLLGLNYDQDDYVYFLNFGGSSILRSGRTNSSSKPSWPLAPESRLSQSDFSATAGITYSLFLNPLFNPDGVRSSLLNNFYFTSSIKMML